MLRSFEKAITYHIFNRAVDRKEIFRGKDDCHRFIFQMYAANIGKPAFNLQRIDIVKIAQAILKGEKISGKFIITEHPPFVDFLSFSLVVDHYHFNLVPDNKNSIPKFMQKLSCGFAKFYNLKHKRTGALFESRYKSVPVQTIFQQDALLRYINIINPLDVFQPGWRDKGLGNENKASAFLNEYQFSSFPDLFGKRRSKILAAQDLLEQYLGEAITKDQEEYIKSWKHFLQDNASLKFKEAEQMFKMFKV